MCTIGYVGYSILYDSLLCVRGLTGVIVIVMCVCAADCELVGVNLNSYSVGYDLTFAFLLIYVRQVECDT